MSLTQATYIPDGYELDFYVAAVPQLHGAIRGKYRPLTVDERDTIREIINSKKAADYNPAIRKMLMEKVTEWDVRRPDAKPGDRPVDVTAATLKGLHPKLFDKLYLIVSGDRASDVPPELTPKEELSYAERLMQHGEGKSPEAEAVKN